MLAHFKQRIRDEEFKNSPELIRYCEKFSLTKNVLNEIHKVYNKVDESENISKLRAHKRQGIIAACIFIGCRNANQPMSMKEISAAINISIRVASKFLSHISVKYQMHSDTKSVVNDYIKSTCHQFKLDDSIRIISQNLIEKVFRSSEISGKKPKTIAVSIIHSILEKFDYHCLTLMKLCTEAQVNQTTIKKTSTIINSLISDSDLIINFTTKKIVRN